MTYEEIKRAAQAAKKRDKIKTGRTSLKLSDLAQLRAVRAVWRVEATTRSDELYTQYNSPLRTAPLEGSNARARVHTDAVEAARNRIGGQKSIAQAVLGKLV